jgi:hypothetical protein
MSNLYLQQSIIGGNSLHNNIGHLHTNYQTSSTGNQSSQSSYLQPNYLSLLNNTTNQTNTDSTNTSSASSDTNSSATTSPNSIKDQSNSSSSNSLLVNNNNNNNSNTKLPSSNLLNKFVSNLANSSNSLNSMANEAQLKRDKEAILK